jgi:hypothetical protein
VLDAAAGELAAGRAGLRRWENALLRWAEGGARLTPSRANSGGRSFSGLGLNREDHAGDVRASWIFEEPGWDEFDLARLRHYWER